LSSASPRNSSRSLCGAPALRWLRACVSRPPSAKAWPPKTAALAGLFVATAPCQLLGREKLAAHVEVGDHRLAPLVVHRHHPAVVATGDLDVLRLHVFGIAD